MWWEEETGQPLLLVLPMEFEQLDDGGVCFARERERDREHLD
jgi:hypothetical protein